MQYQWMLMISGLLKDQKLHDHLRLQQKCYVKQLVVIWLNGIVAHVAISQSQMNKLNATREYVLVFI